MSEIRCPSCGMDLGRRWRRKCIRKLRALNPTKVVQTPAYYCPGCDVELDRAKDPIYQRLHSATIIAGVLYIGTEAFGWASGVQVVAPRLGIFVSGSLLSLLWYVEGMQRLALVDGANNSLQRTALTGRR
jgi:hypothetical protein